MKTTICALFLMLPLATLGQGEVYKHVGSDGTVTFSDKPKKGAQKVEVDPVQTYAPSTFGAPIPGQPSADPVIQYKSISIAKPADGATIWDNPGNVTVDVATVPRLQAGDKVILLLDGKPYGKPSPRTRFELQNINRGEHTIAASIVSSNGKQILTSATITIFMHQASVNMPARR